MPDIYAQNYFNIGHIVAANFNDRADERQEHLHLVVLTCVASDWEGRAETVEVPMARYGGQAGDWCVYATEAVRVLLEEFHRDSTVALRVYYLTPHDITADLTDEVEPYTKHLVLVADPFALCFEASQELAALFDTKDRDKIRGCLIPVCAQLTEEQREWALAKRQQVFRRLCKGWPEELYRSYTHVELDIPNKTHFFRRLANIAYLRGIRERETLAYIRIESKSFQQPPRP